MSLMLRDSPQRAVLAVGLFSLAAAAGARAWLHMNAGWDAFVCGAAPAAHCLACVAGPALAVAGLLVVMAPDLAPTTQPPPRR